MKKLSPITASVVLCLINSPSVFAQNSPSDIESIEIKGVTPLSQQTNKMGLIGSAQSILKQELEDSLARSLPELLKTKLTSVNINDVQNNPFQPDLQYRGFTASPLLGLPQGLSLYLNGSRVNEVFGDTVNWDLMPLQAIESIELYSGSNSVFGQNTLGGAISAKTKTGFSFEGAEVEVGIGQHGRQQVELEAGGNQGNLGYYINASRYEEDGWRDFSPSQVQQVFAALSHHTESERIDFTILHADNELLGNGAVPEELMNVESRSAVYTHPDQTNNELLFLTLNGEFELGESTLLQTNAFFRHTETASINGDDSDFGACQFTDGAITLCELEDDDDDDDDDDVTMDDDDITEDVIPIIVNGEPEAVEFVGFSDDTAFSEISTVDAGEVDGTYNTGNTDAESYGLSGQVVHQYQLASSESEITLGIGYQEGDITYQADTTFGILENDTAEDSRTVTPLMGIMDAEARVRLNVDTESQYLYFLNSSALTDSVTLNIAGRWNSDHIVMDDQIDDGEGSLDGNHKFTRFNPAIGINIQLSENHRLNLSYSQSSRTPSPAELSCADENDPCRLPNGFVADPPLEQVVAKTMEANLIGRVDSLEYSLTYFDTVSEDDIIFQQAGSVASRGYFINVDETQRSGVEATAATVLGDLRLRASYNYLDATYESPFVSFSPMNPLGPGRQVTPGDRIPGQPEHQVKLYAEYQINPQASVGAEYISASEQYYRGDEANENKTIDGYSYVNFYTNYDVSKQFSVQLRVDNLFDSEFETFGAYGEADEVLEDFYPDIDEPFFVGPSNPRTVSMNASYRF